MSTSPPAQPQKPETRLGKRTEQILKNLWEPLDLIGRSLAGELWRTLYLTIQDAIALSLLLRIPSAISYLIIGKSFSSFDVCLQESAFGASRYACFIIVISDFMLWMLLAFRLFGRFFADFLNVMRSRR